MGSPAGLKAKKMLRTIGPDINQSRQNLFWKAMIKQCGLVPLYIFVLEKGGGGMSAVFLSINEIEVTNFRC